MDRPGAIIQLEGCGKLMRKGRPFGKLMRKGRPLDSATTRPGRSRWRRVWQDRNTSPETDGLLPAATQIHLTVTMAPQ